MKWYFLAFLTFIAEMILLVLILTIPVLFYIVDHYIWWEEPFLQAYYKSIKDKEELE